MCPLAPFLVRFFWTLTTSKAVGHDQRRSCASAFFLFPLYLFHRLLRILLLMYFPPFPTLLLPIRGKSFAVMDRPWFEN